MKAKIVVGGQFGDEGKGKIISYLSFSEKPDAIARAGVGPNAGHKIKHNGKTYSLRMVPSGFINPEPTLYIGAGVLIDPKVFLKEVEELGIKGRIFIDKRCAIITEKYKELDAGKNSQKIGTTKTGCGPTQMARAERTVELAESVGELKEFIRDVPFELAKKQNVLIEGSQGFMLSNLYGTYPYVTSKDVSASTFAADVGIGPLFVSDVFLVIKAYTTRVGNGPFKNEIGVKEAEELGFQEYGTVTGRPRRTSRDLHFDDLKLAVQVNSANHICVTKLDVRFPETKGAKSFEELSDRAKEFIKDIEEKLSVPVTLIGTGPGSDEIIDRRI